ncbi:MAG: hypothetical protein KIC69_05305 [Campylobacter concisus]|uniref:Uncharacterized protein n=1 Tax=Campylobacter concisus TaxID=199 RepID=A0A9E1BA26_9BACT|nr:hypothetical protein [Campylobacter concisus]
MSVAISTALWKPNVIYGRFIILDESILNSAYIQLFVLERYDPKVFEPVILDGAAKVYRLKR